MIEIGITRRYVRALFDLVLEDEEARGLAGAKRILSDLQWFQSLLQGDDLRRFLADPRESPRAKQDALAKMATIDLPDLRWHMIGQLQSNKAARVARHFDLVHSLASSSSARAMSRALTGGERTCRVLLQVHLGGGSQRGGSGGRAGAGGDRARLRHVATGAR